jgi:uncharacterized protein with HEPN domain
MGVDLSAVWGVVQKEIPTFKKRVDAILKLENEDSN